MELDVRQNEVFQRREWRVERIGWVLIGALIVAGGIGLLGRGPLSSTTATSEPAAVAVAFHRVTHYEADDSLTITLAPEAASGGRLSVDLTGSWVAAVDLQSITPTPSEQVAIPGGVSLQVPVAGPGPWALQIAFRAQRVDRLTGTVTVADHRVSFSQLVLP